MTAGPGRHGHQTISPLLDRLAGEAVVDDVVQGYAAVGVGGLVDLLACAQRGDEDRHPPFHAGLEVLLQPRIGAVDDLVHRKGRRRPVGMGLIVPVEGFGDLRQPGIQLFLRAGIERRKAADDPGRTLGDHQIGIGDDKERRPNGRDAQIL